MSKGTVKLYVNDPMGKRCMANMDAASRARVELGVEVVVVKRGSEEYLREVEQPPCPSVYVEGAVVVTDGVVTYEALKDAIRKKGQPR